MVANVIINRTLIFFDLLFGYERDHFGTRCCRGWGKKESNVAANERDEHSQSEGKPKSCDEPKMTESEIALALGGELGKVGTL